MRVFCFLVLICLVPSSRTSDPSKAAPQLIYGTYLGGRHKDFATAIAVDGQGNAYITGRTLSPDFPVTAGALSTTTKVNNDDWTGFVSKISERGHHLLFSSFLGGSFRSSANAIAVDSGGRAFVVGSTCSSKFPTTPSAIFRNAPGSDKVDACDGFVAVLNAAGSQLDYGTYLGGSKEDAATAVALDRGGEVIYVGGYTSSPDFPVTALAAQPRLNGSTNGFLCAIEVRSGKLLYSTYLGGSGNDSVTAVSMAGDGTIYIAGTTNSERWPNVELAGFGNGGATDGFVIKLDPKGKLRPVGVRIGGSGNEVLAAIDLDLRGNIYAVGSTDSSNFPVTGTSLHRLGTGFVVKIDGRRFAAKQGCVAWSRRVGGRGEDVMLSVSARFPGSVFVSGRSNSNDFPTTEGAIYRRLSAQNDSILVRLRASDGQFQFATFVGGTRREDADWHNDAATGVLADASGNVYVTGYTADERLPVTQGAFQLRSKGNTEPFVLRMKFAGSVGTRRAP